jgi:hypothetical protein
MTKARKQGLTVLLFFVGFTPFTWYLPKLQVFWPSSDAPIAAAGTLASAVGFVVLWLVEEVAQLREDIEELKARLERQVRER